MNRKLISIDDQDLEALRRCRRGDRQAYAQLVERHKNGVFRMVFRYVGQNQRAEELTQEVFLKAYRDLEQFRGEAKFSTWLYQIALNLCRDYWRSQQRRPEQLLEPEFFVQESSSESSPEERILAEREATRVRRALDSLPEIYREALTMRFFGDLSYEEMADVSGEGLSSLKMRVARGLAQLRNRLEQSP